MGSPPARLTAWPQRCTSGGPCPVAWPAPTFVSLTHTVTRRPAEVLVLCQSYSADTYSLQA